MNLRFMCHVLVRFYFYFLFKNQLYNITNFYRGGVNPHSSIRLKKLYNRH